MSNNIKVGIIGVGNMGQAILRGLANTMSTDDIYYFDLSKRRCDEAFEITNKDKCESNKELVNKSDVIFVAVKPHYYDGVLNDIKDNIKEEKIVVSIAPGITISRIKHIVGANVKVVRSMPNTPVSVGEGMCALSFSNDSYSDAQKANIISLFESFGKAIVIDEKMMNAVVPISGSSPAYFFMMVEAMADAAVLTGLSRKDSYTLAAQTMLGSAKMLLASAEHPGKLKDDVCSPGGATIEAVKVLEEKGFRSAIIDGMKACYDKTKSMEK